MKIAFVGKGGSGKTTFSALFAKYLATNNQKVFAIDGDINQHLYAALGITELENGGIPSLGENLLEIKKYLRNNNQLFSADEMIKTTPPGKGSKIIDLCSKDPILEKYFYCKEGIYFAKAGEFKDEDIGIKCYHSKTGSIELFLNHTKDRDDEYIVLDMTAGADSFSSGLFAKFDLTVIIVEPTQRSVNVYFQYQKLAKDFGVNLMVFGNKIENQEDIEFIQSLIPNEIIGGYFTHSMYVKNLEKGITKSIDKLEMHNLKCLELIKNSLDKTKKDWFKYLEQAIYFHKTNALSWGNKNVGKDLTEQIDIDFMY